MARIGDVSKEHKTLGLGCWTFGGAQWGGQDDGESLRAMARALELGLTHFDTASGYGSGHSERLVGGFMDGKRDKIFLASKQSAQKNKQKFTKAIHASLERLSTDYIDLYYIHWPRSNVDMRPTMEALVEAKEAGIFGAIGVSNFSVEQMAAVSEVGRIDAHQLCYNLLWRWAEADIIPYCIEHGIAIVTYSSIAQGILTGKFPKNPEFADGDQRPNTTLFGPDVWPHVFECVEEMKNPAREIERPLNYLAVQWVMRQPGVTSVLVGARNAMQVEENVAATDIEIDQSIMDRMTQISDDVKGNIPNTGNIFKYYP